MKWFKRIVLSILFFFIFIYLLLFFGSNIFFYVNRSKIENLVADSLLIDKVNIKNFFSIPFFYFKIGDNNLFNDSRDINIKIKNTKIFYNIFNININYPLELIRLVEVDRVYFDGKYGKSVDYIKKLIEKYPYFYISPSQKNLLKVKNVIMNISFLPDLKMYVYVKDFKNFISYNILSFSGIFYCEFNQFNRINFFNSAIDFSINVGVREGSNFVNLSSSFKLSNVLVGGIPIIENETFNFISTNVSRNGIIENLFSLKSKKDYIRFEVKRDFNIDYPVKDRFYFVEYIMPKGNYNAALSGNFYRNKKFDISLFVSNTQAKDRLKVDFYGDEIKKYLDIAINTEILRNFNTKISFKDDVSGKVFFDSFYLKQRLKGNIDFYYKDSMLRIYSEEVSINKINLNGFDTTIQFENDRVNITSKELANGIIINGNISNYQCEGSIKLKNLILGGVNYRLNGESLVKFGLRPFSINLLDIKLRGFDLVEKKNLLSLDIFSTEDKVIIKNFSYNDLFNFTLDLEKRFNTNYIISGNAKLRNKNNIPVTGNMVIQDKFYPESIFLIFDNKVIFNFKKDTFKLYTENYNVNKFGVDGILNLIVEGNFRDYLIENLSLKGDFELKGYDRFKIFSKITIRDRENSYYEIPLFSFENSQDKLFGKGYLSLLDKKRASLSFIRGGKIYFIYDNGNFILDIDLQKLIFKNPFLEENRNVYLNLKALMKKDKDFSIQGDFSLFDTKLPKYFSLEAKNFYIKGENVVINNFYLDYGELTTFFSLYGNDNKYNINGRFIYSDIITTDYLFNIRKNNNSYNAFYRIYNVNPDIVNNISGKIVVDYPFVLFYSDLNGLNGHINLSKDKKDWKIDFINNDIEVFTKGSLSSDKINMNLSYNISLFFANKFLPFKITSGFSKGNISVQGTLNNPDINGNIEVKNLSGTINYSKTQITNFNTSLILTNSYVFLDNVVLPTKTGDFFINGFVNISDIFTPYFELRVKPVDKKSFINISYLENGASISGKLSFNELEFNGNKNRINLKGDLRFDNFSVSLPLTSFIVDSDEVSTNFKNLPENINLNLLINLGNNVKFSTPLNQFVFKRNSIIYINGDLASMNLKVKGNVGIERGDFTYLAKNFSIKEGTITFNDDYIPYVNMVLWYRYRDVDKENVDIYLTFEGKATKIIMKDFYSIPERPKNELAMILGIGVDTKDSVTNIATSDYLKSGVGLAENVFFFSPLSLEIKRRIGLDLFSFRSTIFKNYVESGFGRNTNTDFRDYISGSGIVVGKYIFPMLFMEYELYFEKDPYSAYGLLPLHSLGIELDLPYFDIGWRYQPYNFTGKDTKYEQLLELKFMRKF